MHILEAARTRYKDQFATLQAGASLSRDNLADTFIARNQRITHAGERRHCPGIQKPFRARADATPAHVNNDIAVARRSIEKAEESLRIQREKFATGRATSREVLESTALVTNTRFTHIRALYSYNIALRELHRVRGADPRQPPFPPAKPGNAKEEE